MMVMSSARAPPRSSLSAMSLVALLPSCASLSAMGGGVSVSLPAPDLSGSLAPTSAVEDAYFKEQETVYDVDEGAWKSEAFWMEIDVAIPGWRTDAKLDRFRGFVENLRTEPPGVDLFLDNNQQVLSQYVYPGLDHESVHRSAYPSEAYAELADMRKRLAEDVAPAAKEELAAVLAHQPLAADDPGAPVVEDPAAWDPLNAKEDDAEDETWQLAAWYGWQFLSLRGAKRWAPKTTKALVEAMGDLGPAHRFVGFTRQKAGVRGTVHSDGRNYMLSTLTPVTAPKGCGIFVDGEEAVIATDGPPVVLDNTFPHHVYNDADEDRFVLMSECWHPALRLEEREALATLFAAKDRFTVLSLGMAPWGYTEDDLSGALAKGHVNDLEFWKDIRYDGAKAKKKKKPAKLGTNKRSGGKKAAKKKAFG